MKGRRREAHDRSKRAHARKRHTEANECAGKPTSAESGVHTTPTIMRKYTKKCWPQWPYHTVPLCAVLVMGRAVRTRKKLVPCCLPPFFLLGLPFFVCHLTAWTKDKKCMHVRACSCQLLKTRATCFLVCSLCVTCVDSVNVYACMWLSIFCLR